MARQQLPPGIKKITLANGDIRYEVIADAGTDPVTEKRRQTRKRYKLEAEARTALTEISSSVVHGTYVASSALTVERACADWLAGKRVRRTTMSNYTQALKPLRERHGDLPVQKLTKRMIDDLVTDLAAGTVPRAKGRKRKPWSGGTLNYMVDRIESVLDSLIAQGLLVRNPATLVDRLDVNKKKMDTYSPDEVRKLLVAADQDRNGHAWHLALCGLRRGEIGGMRWADVSFEAGTITIENNRVSANGKAVEDKPKSEESERTLPMTPTLKAVLSKARKAQVAERLALGEAYGPGTHVVCNEAGFSYHPDTLSDYWDKITRKAGVRRIRLHDARHSCATNMHMQGVPIVVVAAWLGHADASFTLRTYVHAQTDALALAASSLESVVTNGDIGGSGDKRKAKRRRGKSAG